MLQEYLGADFSSVYHNILLSKDGLESCLKTGSFKLKDLEHKFGIRRQVVKYKTSIFQIWRDWRNPTKKKAVLLYNKEDVVNLVRLALKIFKKFKIKDKYLESIKLK